jgi:hypothetical protein
MSILQKLSLVVLLTTFALPLTAQNQLAIAPQTVTLGQTDVLVPIRLTNNEVLYGYSLSLLTNSSLLELKDLSTAGTPSAAADWSFGDALDGGSRLSWGVVLDTSEPFDVNQVIPVGNNQVLVNVVIDVVAAAAGQAMIQFQDFPADYSADPPDPGSKNKLLLENGVGLAHTTSNGVITIAGGEGVGPFKRGDCNQDGSNTGQVTDGVYLLNYLFTGGEEPKCLAACDMNGDGAVPGAPTDAVFYFTFNFLGGTALPDPLRDCALSTRAGDIALGCLDPDGCAG